VPTFTVKEQDRAWIATAPVILTSSFTLPATPQVVFDLLADLEGWSRWYKGMRKVEINGVASGVGALRTVTLGITKAQERFLEWVPGDHMTFAIIGSNTPGLGSMVEDWAIVPDAADPTRSVLTATVGLAPNGPLRPFPGLAKAIMGQITKGAVGIEGQFS
jgi:carbon monoxide dehydrogenase subunit G